jgi:phosphohistidine phosphatase SixA
MYKLLPINLAALCAAMTIVFSAANAAQDAAGDPAAALWTKLKTGGHYILLRHAQTEPGSGDPPEFDLADCGTQRNLSEAGRAQAKAIGAAFRAQGVPISSVRSSPFCRCMDTARLAFERVQAWAPLHSVFETSANNDERIAAIKAHLAGTLSGGNEVLVSHNVNIMGATGVSTAQGEAVVVAPDGAGGFSVIGKIAPP